MRLLPLLLLAACATGGTTDVLPAPTWHADVGPALAQRCVRCHDGAGLGPGDLTDPAVAAALAPVLAAKVAAGEMPPPAADPSCHPYEGAERLWMSPDERAALADLITRWDDAGAPDGDPADAPAAPLDAVQHLPEVDVELAVAAPYTPVWDQGNEYRCFLLDADTSVDRWVHGFEPAIDHASISHHTLLFVDPTGSADKYVTDAATQSWHCPEVVPDGDWSMVHAWAPGNNPVIFPDGMGLKIPAGSKLVLQMHYFRSSPEADTIADQPGYRAMLLDGNPGPLGEIYFVPLGPVGFTLPAGQVHTEKEQIRSSDLFGDYGWLVHGVFPHMHVLGSGYEFRTKGPDGGACIATADAYDFANQPTYLFPEPIAVGPEDTVVTSCTWDNRASNPAQLNDPPADVDWGERTDQEMCFMLTYGSVDPASL